MWIATALAAGLLVMPPLVYVTGTRVLGAYANGGLGAFMSDFVVSLAKLELAAWILALAPAVVVAIWRGLLRLAVALERGGETAA